MLWLKFLNAELWQKARWVGVMHAVPADGKVPPRLGMFFADIAAAHMAFEDLIRKTGRDDPRGALRLGVIEGAVPGIRQPGYALNIGPRTDFSFRVHGAPGSPGPKLQMRLFSVCVRLPDNGVGLARFKEAVGVHKRALLIPFAAGTMPNEFDPPLAVWCSHIDFRRVEDVRRDGTDPDEIVLD